MATDFGNYIQRGFRIGYDYRSHTCSPAHSNLPSTREHPEVITKYLMRYVAKGGILGPFRIGSIPNIQISHIGIIAIPKKSNPGKWRSIMDLSYTLGKNVNNAIDPVRHQMAAHAH